MEPMLSMENDMYTKEQRDSLLTLAREGIKYGLENGSSMPVNLSDFDEAFSEERACFVTLKLNGRLRGCIGSLQAHQPLAKDIAQNAYSAAFRDPRFPQLTQAELEQVHISISVLTPAKEINFSSEADLLAQLQSGKDGLILQDGGRRGTFLPSVWEQLPEREMFWQHLKQKAGLPVDHWSETVKVFRYFTEEFGG